MGGMVHSSSGTSYLGLECINSQMLSKDVMVINGHYNHTPPFFRLIFSFHMNLTFTYSCLFYIRFNNNNSNSQHFT